MWRCARAAAVECVSTELVKTKKTKTKNKTISKKKKKKKKGCTRVRSQWFVSAHIACLCNTFSIARFTDSIQQALAKCVPEAVSPPQMSPKFIDRTVALMEASLSSSDWQGELYSESKEKRKKKKKGRKKERKKRSENARHVEDISRNACCEIVSTTQWPFPPWKLESVRMGM